MILGTTPEQLAELRDALERGDDMTPKLRGQLLGALYDLGMCMAIEEKKHQRGNPVSYDSWLAGRLAAALHKNYGVNLKDAARIARNKCAPQVKVSAIELKCRQVRKGETPVQFGPLNQHFVDEALDALRRPIEKTEPGEIPLEAGKVQDLFLKKYGNEKKRNK